ncbi:MAG: GIY-YIG nuclease family protein [Alteromonadales bacterium]|nr:GIY-YIG nuclease family protein [Alteromonadales bacterium]
MKELQYGVYFIYCGDRNNSPVKIGVTSDIESRVSSLQTGNPYQLDCKAFIPCSNKEQAYRLESFFHRQFRKSRMIGEWFKLYRFDLKKLLDRFSSIETIPLKKQGFNIVKQANKRNRRLERENSELKIQIIDLEEQVEELTQINMVNGANLFQ